MPLVTVQAVSGRTVDQKRGLVRDITEAFVKNYNVKPDAVTITLIDLTKDSVAKEGKLFIDR
ncbi:tautomerase family protein [Chloroflexota bacterium]